MSGNGKTNREVAPDYSYNSVLVSKVINYLMRKGKKTVATKIVYGALNQIKEKTQKDPVEILDLAIRNASPLLEIKPKRVGGAIYQVPSEVKGDRKISLAMRWIIQASKSKKGGKMQAKLAEELINASKNEGSAVKKKEDTHRMAEANRAFAHIRF